MEELGELDIPIPVAPEDVAAPCLEQQMADTVLEPPPKRPRLQAVQSECRVEWARRLQLAFAEFMSEKEQKATIKMHSLCSGMGSDTVALQDCS